MSAPPPVAAGDRDRVRVFLNDIEVFVPVGLHPWERHPERPNRILVSIELFGVWPLAHARPDGKRYIDYDRLRTVVVGWENRPHVDLLETLLEELAAAAFDDPNVDSCRVSVAKPDIFPETARAGVELTRSRPHSQLGS
jgi:dihydroneopterin aldolase